MSSSPGRSKWENLSYYFKYPADIRRVTQNSERSQNRTFVAFDPEELCPHELVAIAEESGVHAQVIDL